MKTARQVRQHRPGLAANRLDRKGRDVIMAHTKLNAEAAIAEHYAGGMRAGKIHRNGTNRPIRAARNRQHLVAACGRRVNWALGVPDFDPLVADDGDFCKSCFPLDHFKRPGGDA